MAAAQAPTTATSGPDGTLTVTSWFPPTTGPGSQYTLPLLDANEADLDPAAPT